MYALTACLLVFLGLYQSRSEHVCLLQHAYELSRTSATSTFNEEAGHSGQLTKQPKLKATGKSITLGNAISEWLMFSIPGYAYASKSKLDGQKQYWSQCEDPFVDGLEATCFSRYLWNRSVEVRLDADQLVSVNAEMERNGGTSKILYYPSILKAILGPAGRILADNKLEYAEAFAPNLVVSSPSNHCVVHYRVGDLVEYLQEHYPDQRPRILSPKSVASAVASFRPPPLTVEILNGGTFHFDLLKNHSQRKEDIEVAKSLQAIIDLKDAIAQLLPDAQVSISSGGTPDEDWFKLSQAPMAAVSLGSFALSAVLAGTNNQVRSPASKHLLNPWIGQEAPTQMRPGWTSYEFELEDW
jgi:hypothetical protein